jgi:hypothetical protein
MADGLGASHDGAAVSVAADGDVVTATRTSGKRGRLRRRHYRGRAPARERAPPPDPPRADPPHPDPPRADSMIMSNGDRVAGSPLLMIMD